MYFAKKNGAPKVEYPKIRFGTTFKNITDNYFCIVVPEKALIPKKKKFTSIKKNGELGLASEKDGYSNCSDSL